jgi:hypothetical protein
LSCTFTRGGRGGSRGLRERQVSGAPLSCRVHLASIRRTAASWRRTRRSSRMTRQEYTRSSGSARGSVHQFRTAHGGLLVRDAGYIVLHEVSNGDELVGREIVADRGPHPDAESGDLAGSICNTLTAPLGRASRRHREWRPVRLPSVVARLARLRRPLATNGAQQSAARSLAGSSGLASAGPEGSCAPCPTLGSRRWRPCGYKSLSRLLGGWIDLVR